MKQWSTRHLPGPAQFEYWREVICQSFVPLRPERLEAKGPRRKSASTAFDCTLTSWEIGDVFFGQVAGQGQKVFRAEADISVRDRAVYFLNIQHQGQAKISQSGYEAELGPRSFALVDATSPFQMQVSDRFEQLSIKIPKSRLRPLLDRPEQALAHRVACDAGVGSLVVEAFSCLSKQAEHLDAGSMEIAIEQALALTACALNRAADSAQEALEVHPRGGLAQAAAGKVDRRQMLRRQAIAYLSDNLEDPELNSQKVANALGVSARYVQAAFAANQSSVGHWILNRRLELCRQALMQSTCIQPRISQTAFQHGFNDLSHFNRAFKHKFGVTPSRLRNG
jgi:AraC family transcriptional regulator, positive regulator of tynA and feaB